MRIVFVTQCHPCRELGGSRAQLELAEEWAAQGRTCVLLGPEELIRAAGGEVDLQTAFEAWLRGLGCEFDVVDYDHNYLLPERAGLPPGVLYVARSVLFIPFVPLLLADDYAGLWRKIKLRLRRILAPKAPPQPGPPLYRIVPAMRRADALNVPNTCDAALAAALGIPSGKILLHPFAISRARRAELEAVRGKRLAPEFVFVGIFDSRKGGPVLPGIFARLKAEFPAARLTLLGAGGKADGKAIRRRFAPGLRDAVQVVPSFDNDELPSRLAKATVGLFPSRHEGFPFAVLEQLHAGVPVAAYDAPGVCDQLPQDWLTLPGDPAALAACAARLMRGVLAGEPLDAQARAHAARFRIEDVAEDTWTRYAELVAAKAEHERSRTCSQLKGEV